jgi:F-type H+-transporting ATPase subunit delta
MGARIDDQELAVAGVYAGALLELAARLGREEDTLLELEQMVELLAAEEDFAAFLANPTVPFEQRRATIERTFRDRADDLVVNTLQVMNKRDRLGLLPALAEAYRERLDDRLGREHVEVRTAVPLTEVLRSRLKQVIASMTGRTIRLDETVDESLIGGLVVKIGDEKIDSSVQRSLALLGERLADRSSHEVQSTQAYVTDSEATE